MTFEERAKKIHVFLFDVNGIFTSPNFFIFNQKMTYSYYQADFEMLRILQKLEYPFGFISKGKNQDFLKQIEDLSFLSYFDQKDKWSIYQEILEENHYHPEEVFYMGDGFYDLPILRNAGLAITVPHAPKELQKIAHKVTQKEGGHGAVSEILYQIFEIKNIFLC